MGFCGMKAEAAILMAFKVVLEAAPWPSWRWVAWGSSNQGLPRDQYSGCIDLNTAKCQ